MLPVFIAAATTEDLGEEGIHTLIIMLRSNIIMEYPATALCAALGAVLLDDSKTILNSDPFVRHTFHFLFSIPIFLSDTKFCSKVFFAFVIVHRV